MPNSVVFPKVLMIITGKGPQRACYLPLLEEFNKMHTLVTVRTI